MIKKENFSGKHILCFFLIAAVLAAGITFFSDFSAEPADGKKARVVRVIDGDTYIINYGGREEKLRLIGIDTPETRANRKALKDALDSEHDVETMLAMGNESREWVRTLVPAGAEITLEFDVQQRDKYGRLLAYVYLENGEMLNEKIIAEGYASPMTYPPNIRYQHLFTVKYQKARYEKKGLWKSSGD